MASPTKEPRPNLNPTQITLQDGRRLAYAEFGAPDGEPVLYFHGTPSSRLEPLLVGEDTFRRHGLRIIAPDRPGMGGSDFQPGRGFSHWPADVAFLADCLGLPTFNLLGVSGGCPYVAACAARIPERIRNAVVVSGAWRMDWPEARNGMPFRMRMAMTLARRSPWLLRILLRSRRDASPTHPQKELAAIKKRMHPADYALFATPGRLEAFAGMTRESMRQGPKGAAHDMGLWVREFDFDPGKIRIPLKFFHGDQDFNTPIAMARRMAAGLPTAKLITYKGEAHLSTLCNQFADIAQALTPK